MAEDSRSPQATADPDEAIREEIRAKLRQRKSAEPEDPRRKRALTDPEKAGITIALSSQSQYL
jgi:hypothetical protein